MQIILLEDVKSVGKKGDIVKLSDGYARNFLLPKKLAVEANAENLSKLKSKQESNQFREDTKKEDAIKLSDKLKDFNLKIKVKAGENGKIFGGVTPKEIAQELKTQYNIDIDKKKISLNETIKNLGNYMIDIKLYEGVVGKLKVEVIS